jgi:hypothetical protein
MQLHPVAGVSTMPTNSVLYKTSQWAQPLRTLKTSSVSLVSASARARRPPAKYEKRSRSQKPTLLPPPIRDVPVRDIPNTGPKSDLHRFLVPAKIIEFRHNDDYILGLIVKEALPEGMMSVVSAAGTVYGVRQQQVSIVLPGKGRTLEDLQAIQGKVRRLFVCACFQ